MVFVSLDGFLDVFGLKSMVILFSLLCLRINRKWHVHTFEFFLRSNNEEHFV